MIIVKAKNLVILLFMPYLRIKTKTMTIIRGAEERSNNLLVSLRFTISW